MKRMISTLLMTVALTTAAQAQSFTDQLISQYQGHGFTRVEVKNGPTQTKVEAIRGTQKVEVVYDRSTGEIIKQESERVRAGEDTRAGIEVDTRSRDFVGDDRRTASSDDDDGDGRGRGRGRGSDDDDDSNDDDRGRGRGGDDHGSDDD